MENHTQYLETEIRPIMEKLILQLVCQRPEDPAKFMLDYFQKISGYTSMDLNPTEKQELESLRREVMKYREAEDSKHIEDNDEEKNELDDKVEEMPNVVITRHKYKIRTGISAEAYGKFNKKEEFTPRVIPKTDLQINKIKSRILQSFLFNNLDPQDIKIVIGAMEEKAFTSGEYVITQGEPGDCLYVVESGELDCYKIIQEKSKDPIYLKTYLPGEAFGELALLYNARRAASIIAKTNVILWALDRDTFNNIVKDSARIKREKYQNFLKSVNFLHTMDSYEIGLISDALKTCSFQAGEFVIRQGEIGDAFYIIEDGEASGYITKENGKILSLDPMTVGDYFGEYALMKGVPRTANIIAKTDLKCVTLDRNSFKRLLGPIDDILKRKAENYKKVINKFTG